MEDLSKQYQSLREAVEKAAGRKMNTPRDFNHLVACIQSSTNELISATTLKRFWGYLENDKVYRPFKHTLDVLSTFVGYKSWENFCNSSSATGSSQSDYLNNNRLYTTSLLNDDKITLLWGPDRKVEIKYLGLDLFEVVESTNSKLKVGDRFCCGHFIDGEPLYLSRLIRDNGVIGDYVCGRNTGINFILHKRGV